VQIVGDTIHLYGIHDHLKLAVREAATRTRSADPKATTLQTQPSDLSLTDATLVKALYTLHLGESAPDERSQLPLFVQRQN